MTLSINDLNLQVDLPELPASVPVAQLEAASYNERREAIEALAEALDLDNLKPGETEHSLAFVGERGEIEYFPASGAVWAHNAEIGNAFSTELRQWEGLEESERDGENVYELDRDSSGKLMDQAAGLLEAAHFLEKEGSKRSIALDQVAELDEEGGIIQSGAGTATVMTRYSVEGLPVMGAGAKTHVYLEPTSTGIQTTGAFHCWRRIAGVRKVDLLGVKEALRIGVLDDPELMRYREKGSRIEVTELTFGYLALPAMVRQSSLLPAFAIAGRVQVRDEKMDYFEFARYHHAVSTDQYRDLGLFGPQLSVMN